MPLRRIFSATLALAVTALAAFHGWLFAAQLSAGKLEDPWVILRWTAASTIVVALAVLHYRGESIWGRKGIAIWALAALLHTPAIAKNFPPDLLGLPETAVAATLQIAPVTGLALSIWLLAALWKQRRQAAVAFAVAVDAQSLTIDRDVSLARPFTPRPPPVRA